MSSIVHDRLRTVLEQEYAKGHGKFQPGPSKFRETALDTHPIADPEDFRAAYIYATQTKTRYGSKTMASNNTNSMKKIAIQRKREETLRATRSANTQEPVTFRSVFQPTPDQEHVCSLSRERRDRIANSEWALLDTLEVTMAVEEKEARFRRYKATQVNQRQALDQQMKDVERAKRAEQEEKVMDGKVLQEELERFTRDQAQKQAEERQRNMALRQERERNLEETRNNKAAADAARKAQEAAELEAIQKQLEYERAKAAQKVATAKAAMDQTRRDNVAKMAARKAEEARQKLEDEELMKKTIATLERQEREREEKLKQFYASIAARADRVGQQAVAENRERVEREARLVAQFEAQKEAEYALKEAAMKAKKDKQKEDLIKSRQDYLKQREAKAAAEKEAVQQERVAIDRLAEAEAAAQLRKMAGLKDRASAHKDFIRTQMNTRERVNVEDDTGMSARERELNQRLLNHATRIVGKPTQFSIKF